MVGGGVLSEFGRPAVEVALARPGPAISDGERLTDGGDSSVDVAVGVGVVDDGGFGLGDSGVGSTEVLLFKVKGPGAKKDNWSAVRFGDIDDDMRKNEIMKVDEGGSQLFFIAGLIGFDNGGAKLDHAEVVKTEEGRSEEHERDEN